MRISAVLIVRDEAYRLANCLESLRWTDEIVVVVDAATTDETAEIARGFTERVFERAFDDFSSMRTFGDDQATGDWILSVDADEIVTPALATEVRAVVAGQQAAFRIPHLDYMFGRWIRHGGWYPQYHLRLYRRGKARWGNAVHERVAVDGGIGTLREPLLHFSHGRVSDFVAKLSRYTSVEAESAWAAGRRTNPLRLLVEPPLYAGYKYFWQQGWRDGMHGLALALLMGAYRLVVHLKLWDLQQHRRGLQESPECPPRM